MSKRATFEDLADREQLLNIDDTSNEPEFEIDDASDDDNDVSQPQSNPAEIDIIFPCNIAMCAAPISGKSSMILSIVDDEDFDLTFVVSLTPGNSNFEDIATAVLPSLSEKFIQDLLELHEQDKELKTLLIFDDFIGSEKSGFNVKNSPGIDQISSAGRHSNISMIFSSQNWVSIPVIFRRSANYYFLGANTHNINKDLSKILANGSMTPKRLFLNLENISSENNYDFIIFDRKKKSWHKAAPTIRSKSNNGIVRR